MKRIVHIEDVSLEQELYRRLHATARDKFHGEVRYEVASTWSDGMRLLEQPADVLVLDLTLPGMSQEETLKVFAEKLDSLPPTMILTGAPDTRELRRKCILLGACDLMSKELAKGDPVSYCERLYHIYLNNLRRQTLGR